MATPNYGYEKRQRELAKKQKKEEKLKHKAERKSGESAEHAFPGDTETNPQPQAPGETEA